MMPFTDDDVKRLKESLVRQPKSAFVSWFEVQDMESLLARMEASDAVAAYFANHPDSERFSPYARKAIETWRKEAGR